jgi:hypothetical protein
MDIYEIEKLGKIVQAERLRQAQENYMLAEIRRERRERRLALWRQRLAAWLGRLPAPGRAARRRPQSEPR